MDNASYFANNSSLKKADNSIKSYLEASTGKFNTQISKIQSKLDDLLSQMEALNKEKEESRNCCRHKRG